MDTSRNDLLGEIAADAALERSDFLAAAAAQLDGFLEANAGRIDELGGLVLIDDDSDYLAIAPDGTFRSRTRYQDEATGQWKSETETIESASELVELYNLADVFAAFEEATKIGAGLPPEPTATPDLLATADIQDTDTVALDEENAYAAAADDWAATQEGEEEEPPQDEEEAAQRLYDLALAFQERSQQTESHLLDQFESAASRLTSVLGDLIVVDDDERLTLQASGSFVAEVIPESDAGSGEWRRLASADELVEFYDPTDVFGDLADALAEAFPAVAPEDAEGLEAEEFGDEGETEERGEREEGEEGEEDEDGEDETEDAEDRDRR